MYRFSCGTRIDVFGDLELVERFGPEKIVLFGSHAYGQPNCDSDVDVLVVMPTKNQVEQACRIRLAVEHPFPLDLLVRTPAYLKARVEAGDCFLQEILSEGVVLYVRNSKSEILDKFKTRSPNV